MATAAAVRDRPIAFSGPMVRAILDGSKSQTRRVLRCQPLYKSAMYYVMPDDAPKAWQDSSNVIPLCPYGRVGERLWVRERHTLVANHFQTTPGVVYDADGEVRWNVPMPDGATVYNHSAPEGWRARPAMFLRREHARILLELTDVRIERVQSITEDDARAEGITEDFPAIECNSDRPFAEGYRHLWDSLNAKRGFGWDANPWVWVLSFKRVTD